MGDDSETSEEWEAPFPQNRVRAPLRFWRKLDPKMLHRIPEFLKCAKTLCPPETTAGVLLVNPVSGFELAGWWIARKYGVPHHIYFLDECRQLNKGMLHGFGKTIGARLLDGMLTSASSRFCINPLLQANYFEKFYPTLRFTQLPMSCPPGVQPAKSLPKKELSGSRNRLIVFTGHILPRYNLTPLKHLIDILNEMDPAGPRLVIATPDPPHRLARFGLSSSQKVALVSLNSQECMKLQNEADLLFLPVTCDYKHKSYAKTTFPSKTIEYLASTARILIYGSHDVSFFQYMEEHNLAVTVDAGNKALLRQTILHLVDHPELNEAEKEARDRELALHDPRNVACILMTKTGLAAWTAHAFAKRAGMNHRPGKK